MSVVFETSTYVKKEGEIVGCTVICSDNEGVEIGRISVVRESDVTALVKMIEEVKKDAVTKNDLKTILTDYLLTKDFESTIKNYLKIEDAKTTYTPKTDFTPLKEQVDIISNKPTVSKRLLMGRLGYDGKGEFEGAENGYLSLTKGAHSIACKLEGYVQGTDKAEVSILV